MQRRGCLSLIPKIEDNMNQQTANSSFTNNSSGPTNLLAPSATDNQAPAPADSALPGAMRHPKSAPKANRPKAGAPTLVAKKGLAAKTEDRCRHYTAAGRRCRLTALDPASGLCFRHVGRPFQPSDEDLSSAFAGLLSGFQSPSRIHAFLTQVTVLLVQNRVSTRRAAILAYLGQTLLRTLPAINDELNPPDEPQHIIFDVPRPEPDDPVDPETAFYERMAKYNTSPNLGSSTEAVSADKTK